MVVCLHNDNCCKIENYNSEQLQNSVVVNWQFRPQNFSVNTCKSIEALTPHSLGFGKLLQNPGGVTVVNLLYSVTDETTVVFSWRSVKSFFNKWHRLNCRLINPDFCFIMKIIHFHLKPIVKCCKKTVLLSQLFQKWFLLTKKMYSSFYKARSH